MTAELITRLVDLSALARHAAARADPRPAAPFLPVPTPPPHVANHRARRNQTNTSDHPATP